MLNDIRHLGVLGAALAVLACQPGAPPGGAPQAQARPGVAARVTEVLGVVRVPAQLVGPDGGTLIGVDGGTLRPTAAAARRLLGLDLRELRGARVYLADAGGQAIPAAPPAVTNPQGRFRLRNAPTGTFMVVAEVPATGGKRGIFRSLVRVTEAGASTVLDHATTLVTVNLIEGLKGGDLGGFNPATFRTATELTARSVTADRLPDFTDMLAVRAAMARLAQDVDELRGLVGELRAEVSRLSAKVEALERGHALGASGEATTPPDDEDAPDGATSQQPGGDGGPLPPLLPARIYPYVKPAAFRQADVAVGGLGSLAEGPDGWLYAADAAGNQVIRIWEDNNLGVLGWEDRGPSAPWDLAFGGGQLFVTASGGNEVWQSSRPKSVPPEPVRFGGIAVNFRAPRHLATNQEGTTLYTTSQNQHGIRRWSGTGEISEVWVGSAEVPGFADGVGPEARFNGPTGLAVDFRGDLLVADTGNHRIRRVHTDGTVTTLAGSVAGHLDGPGGTAQFSSPQGLGVDRDGNLYVADRGNRCIRRVAQDGTVTTVAGGAGAPRPTDDEGDTALGEPLDVVWFLEDVGDGEQQATCYVSEGGSKGRILYFYP
ncbi:MAG: hypothetical protein VKS61_10880 [Candidatus Sericytochromatia bacterium]|nr:hypothetical protein [Candidatus Sericytochromatia bacterium]